MKRGDSVLAVSADALAERHPVLARLAEDHGRRAHDEIARRGDLGTCPICHDSVVDRGHFWEGHVTVERKGRLPLILHPGCLHPEVIVVCEPLSGKTSENVRVGRLTGAPDGNDGWWLSLDRVASSKVNPCYGLSIPWPRVRKIELRYAR